MDLPAYRRSAETFVSALTDAYYRHYSGLEAEYRIEPIYEAHAELFERESVDALRGLTAAAASGSEQRRRLTMLLDFATDGFIGNATKQTEAELARREAAAEIELAGERIGFRQSAVVQANEPDAGRRELIEQARLLVTKEQLGPLHRELTERQRVRARAGIHQLPRVLPAVQADRPRRPASADRGLQRCVRGGVPGAARAAAAAGPRDRPDGAAPRRSRPVLQGDRR